MKTKTAKFFSFFTFYLLFFAVQNVWSQVPANYFNSAIGLTGSALKQELHNITTTGHVKLSYAALWTAYYTTDVYPSPNNTKVWDVYSGDAASNASYSGTAPYYLIIGTDQDDGTGSAEGDKYNREHTIPNSWWGGTDQFQYTDLHCLFATDKIVNNKRANYAYGEVTSPTWTSLNGSKLGPNNVSGSGYTGVVFEPIDAFKGDLARAYFYFAVRYKDEIPGWVSSYGGSTDIDVVFNSSGDFNTWYLNMLYSWHLSDPPSNKEILRNNAIYNTNQKNANPFVAHPEWVCDIWFNGTCSTTPELAVSPTSLSSFNYAFGSGPSVAQSFSISGSNLDGSQITITAPANYEVSLSSGSGYSSSVTVSYTGSTLNSTNIYVRLASGLAVNTYTGNVTCDDNGTAANVTVALSGSVSSVTPTLTVNPTSLSGFTYVASGGGPSTEQSYTLSGVYLTGYPSNIVLNAPANYEISLTSGSGFAASVNVPYTSATLNAKIIYVRLKAGLTAGTYSGNITNTGGGATAVNVALNGTVTSGSTYCANDLIISEYIEGASNNKYIELYNGTGATINLANYDLVQYNNGGANIYTLALSGSIASSSTFVIENSSEALGITANLSTNNSVMTFNGNDAIALRKSSSVIDIVGNPNSSANFAIDVTLVRNSNVTNPVTTYNSAEWTSYATNTVSYLGSHTMNCASTPTITVNPSSLTGFTYTQGSGPSTFQYFVVSGTNLTANILLNAPTEYEISLSSGSGYTNSITLTQSSGAVSNTNIYVRLKAGLSAGSYNSENIAISSTGATNQTVTCSGSVTIPTPTITVGSITGFGDICTGSNSTEKFYSVSGINLTANI